MKTFLILSLFIITSFTKAQSPSNDIIDVLRLNTSETDTIRISDIFYSGDYGRIKFNPAAGISAVYSAETGELAVNPGDYEGFGLIDFSIGEEKYAIPFKAEKRFIHNFTFKTDKKEAVIAVFGSFNGWNRESIYLKDQDNNGIYSAGVPLEPGIYEYRFTADGEEILDPANPEKKPNGFGGYNSTVTIKPRFASKAFLHILGRAESGNEVVFSFIYENEGAKGVPGKKDILALLDNRQLNDTYIRINGSRIDITLTKDLLSKYKLLRVGVSYKGQPGNVQNIPLSKDSKYAGFRNNIIYALMIDRFNDGDKSNTIPVEHPELSLKANYQGGDLQGIIDKIEGKYFDSLGVNTLWLSPVADNTPNAFREYPAPHRYYTGYHGYWPVSPVKVEERFGDMELLKKLVNTAHNHGMKVLLDFVANHIHIEHPFWKEHRDWFGNLELPDGSLNLRLWDEQRLTTWFEPYMPSFDYDNSPEALEAMTDNAVWWLKETGVDGFRHDAVKHVPNSFWRMLTEKIKKELEVPNKKGYYQIGETFGSYDLVSSYVNNGQLDAQFNFILYDTALPVFINRGTSFAALDDQMQKTLEVYGANHVMGNVMDSHDKVRYMSYADGDLSFNDESAEVGWYNPPYVDSASSYDKLKLYLAYINTIPGIPVIYYGDEIGMTGASDPDNRRMMRFGAELKPLEKQTLAGVRDIINVRKNSSALKFGDFYTAAAEGDKYIYIRSDMNGRVLTALNKGTVPVTEKIKLPGFYNTVSAADLLSGKKYNVKDDAVTVTIPPYGFIILELK